MNLVRAGLTLISGTGAGFALRLVRNVVIARAISVENYGIASTFTVAVSLLSMATNLNLGKLIVQSRSGNDDRFIHAVNGIVVARGLVMSGLLFVTAGLMARLFGQPELAWAYQIVALYPLLMSFKHSDIHRLNRQMRFLPAVLSDTLPLFITVLLAWPLAAWFHDFRAMLAILMIEAVICVAATHFLAERPFRIRWRWEVAREALKFGWPLMVGSLAIFATQQGDRILVANYFGAYQLGLFSAALTLTMPACLQTGLILEKFFLPLLSRVQDNRPAFDHRALLLLQVTLCIAIGAGLGFALLGAPVVLLVFGERYAGAAPLVGLTGLMFAIQILRGGATTIALARGHTVNILVANLVRIAFLPAALAVAVLQGSVPEMILAGIAGQIVAFAISLALLVRRSDLGGLQAMILPFGLAILVAGLTIAEIGGIGSGPAVIGMAFVLYAALILSCQIMMGELLARLPRKRPQP